MLKKLKEKENEFMFCASFHNILQEATTYIHNLYDFNVHGSIQIMNGCECDGTDISMSWKIKCHIQRGKAKNVSKVTAVHYLMLHCTIGRYYWTLTSYAFNGLSILYKYTIFGSKAFNIFKLKLGPVSQKFVRTIFALQIRSACVKL